jgi:hypothetical protein
MLQLQNQNDQHVGEMIDKKEIDTNLPYCTGIAGNVLLHILLQLL